VRSAIGFDERRGDRVEVVSMRFAAPEGSDSAGDAGVLGLGIGPATLARLAESAIYAVVALLAILLVVRPMARRLTATLVPQPALAGIGPERLAMPASAGAGALGGPAAVGALPGSGAVAGALAGPMGGMPGEDEMVSLDNVQGQLRASSIARVNALMEAHPDEGLAVMRRWLAPEEN
jgi:flagellar M-ring protein FliF